MSQLICATCESELNSFNFCPNCSGYGKMYRRSVELEKERDIERAEEIRKYNENRLVAWLESDAV